MYFLFSEWLTGVYAAPQAERDVFSDILFGRFAPVMWTAFFLFRAFDMFKIYPINKLEERGGGAGIMLDDIVAGIYTNIIMQIALCFVIVQ